MIKQEKSLETVLGVSLIHGQFLATAIVKGQLSGSWSAPDLVEGTESLRMALAEAIRATNFSGHHVSLLLEDDRLVHQYHLVPPMKKKDLDAYLGRMAEKEKSGEGQATWKYRKAKGGRGQQGVLLDVWPQSLVDDVIQACHGVSLTPVQLFPLSVVFVDQVRTLGAEPSDILLLVTQNAGKIVLVIATGDGTPLFDRFLSGDSAEALNPHRIGQEITRSLLFVRQHLDAQVEQVWVMGDSAALSPELLQPFVEATIEWSPITPDPSYWIFVGVNLPLNHDTNFIPKELRQARKRRALAKISVALLAGLACLSVSTTSLIEALVVQGQTMAGTVHDQVRGKYQEKVTLERQIDEWNSQRAWAQAIVTNREPPVAGWFLGYLADVLPKELVLTRVSVVKEGAGWDIELGGTAPPGFSSRTEALKLLERRLVEGPYRVKMSRSWQDNLAHHIQGVGSRTASQRISQFDVSGRIS